MAQMADRLVSKIDVFRGFCIQISYPIVVAGSIGRRRFVVVCCRLVDEWMHLE